MTERAALSVQEFCASYGIGRSTYFEARKLGRMPKAIKLGRRVILTTAAIEEWRCRMEREADARV